MHACMHEIDLASAILEKLEENKKKYPADKYKGKAYLTS
jgi:Zn finger protein HypA/HybF involved in hydrogenase expression